MPRQTSLLIGLAFISPWLFGFAVFMLYPMVASIYFSFCDYSVLQSALFIGLENYIELFGDKVFRVSLGNTLFYAFFALGLGLVVSIGEALLLNMKVKGMAFHRTIIFLPSLVPVVALSVLWMWIFNGESGLLNAILEGVGLPAPNWLGSEDWAMPALILMSLWGIGHPVVIYLAGLQDIPRELYEAAEIDGAGSWDRFWNVTLPMLTPVVYFNVVMGIIGTFQVFAQPYIMTQGGPGRATYFYALALYDYAFMDLRMGYASAMAWILFIIILGLTLLATRVSQKWVQYDR
ncbi:MAG: sugar ABC transporter permease [Planctomycetota bacterium]|nr:sugar ABC transporter permease [Planctomycetota bacterium]MDP7249003.1 sugar ABC transporter permease [Planctomycetota bacterium]